MRNEKIGIWGPPVISDSTAPKNTQKDTMTSIKKSMPARRIKWGVSDVFLGIGLIVFSQVLMAVLAIVVFMSRNAANGVDFTDQKAITDALVGTTTSGPFILASSLSMYVSWLYVVHRASHKRGLGSLAKDFWLKFNWKKDILIGVLLALLLRGAEFGITTLLPKFGVNLDGSDNSAVIVNQQGFWYFVNAIVIAIFLAPFFEELFFRGLLLQTMLRLFRQARPKVEDIDVDMTRLSNITGIPMYHLSYRLGKIQESIIAPFFKYRNFLAALVSAAAFGFMHYQGTSTFGQWFVIIETGIIGFILSYAVYKTKRLGTSITTHIMFNASGIILASLLSR